MRLSALEFLACPGCQRSVVLDAGQPESDGHVMSGELRCIGCDARYPVSKGVPRFLVDTIQEEATETADRFGEQWKQFDHMADYQEDWLLGWLGRLKPEDFRNKIVFEAGCGKGRHAQTIAGWEPKSLISLDLGQSVDVAFEHTRGLKNVHIVQGDILNPPLAKVFDVAFSVGVLHHLPDPRAGFESVSSKVKPGGNIAIWVYGYESNEWIVKYVNPVRRNVTARMNHKWLYWLTLPPSAALASYTRLYKNELAYQKLPYRQYMKQLSALPVREVHNIVYDQMVTPIAYYLSEEEVRSWFHADRFKNLQMDWYRKMSWCASAEVTK